jgi:hypothetical protein
MRLSEKSISESKCGPIQYKPVYEFNTATAETREDAGRSVSAASGRLANCLTLRYITLYSVRAILAAAISVTRVFGHLKYRSKVFSSVYPLLWQDKCLCPGLLHKAAVASRLCSCKKLCQKTLCTGQCGSRRRCLRGEVKRLGADWLLWLPSVTCGAHAHAHARCFSLSYPRIETLKSTVM